MDENNLKNFGPDGHCPVREVLSRLGDKWTILVLATLMTNGTLRFGEIQRTIGDISQRMLTVTLRSLENDGIINRTIYAEVPPRVEYRLTPLGCDLYTHIEALVTWANNNIDTIMTNRSNCCAS